MKHFINKNGQIFGFELDGSQDFLITDDMIEIYIEEINKINQAKENEQKQTLDYKINEAQSYLNSTEWVKDYKLRHDLGLALISEDSSKWEVLNKREEYIIFLKGITK